MKKLSLLFIAIFVVVGGTVVFVTDSNNRTAKAEERQQLNDLKVAGADLAFSDKIIPGRNETIAELTAIKNQCDKQKAFSEKAAKLRNNQQSFQKLQASSRTLFQGCNSYLRLINLQVENTKLTDQKQALLVPYGDDTCASKKACLPPENAGEYKKLFKSDVEFTQKQINEFSNECLFPELKKLCNIHAEYYSKRLLLDEAYYKALSVSDFSDESNAYDSLPFPREKICAEVQKATSRPDIKEHCSTAGTKLLAVSYESKIRADLTKL